VPNVRVLDSTIHYEEECDGNPVVFLHGNPTSSFLWREVIPELNRSERAASPPT